ncbi:thioredoxin [Pseudomaricurvus alkylphenolicus]|uniref:thioredoxin n=1 Tax=Pseudomaricurvus alkylphenolicus TaxID=1306991 RepID=UPI001423BA41|nr:thioredoxin [Pseudomaricurvus alkylphenolicus]NIB44006.1 thioredoxin [Pseudomaricurvus alkylphenolicus]
MSPHIIDVTQENAQQVLIEESNSRPVVVDFWADWCEPCKTLMPILEKLANEYAGQFLLAKVNADELQPIAQQLGVRSLPTVMIMKNGQPVDGFAGAQPETQIREILQKHLPDPWEGLIQQANELMAAEDFNAALPLLLQAYQDSSEKADIGVGLAQVYLHLNRLDEAEALLDKVTMVDQDAAYEQAMAQLKLKREASSSPELKALEEKVQANPEDAHAAYQLAIQYSQNNQAREALELLMGVLRKDLNFDDGAAKKAFMDIIASLGKGDPLAAEYQRKIYTLLY